mgnify:CR=1 FL=1
MKSYKELLSYYEEAGRPSGHDLNKKEHTAFKKSLISFVDDLFMKDLKGEKKFGLYMKCLLESICEPPECENCGSPVASVRKTEFATYCSRKCMGAATVDKRKETIKDRYGVENAMHLDEVKEKVKQTTMKNFGVEYSMQSEEVKEKSRSTCMDRYGVPYYLSTEEAILRRVEGTKNNQESIRKKTEQTNMERFGVPCVLQLPSVREKAIKAIEENQEEIREKIKITSLLRYGVDHPAKAEETKKKTKATLMQKYGVESAMHDFNAVEKLRKTNLEKYGSETITQLKFVREGLQKFYEENPFYRLEEEKRNIVLDKSTMEELHEKYITYSNIANIVGVSDGVIKRAFEYHNISHENVNESGFEKSVSIFVDSLGIDNIKRNVRFDGMEVDIYIENLNIGIECNGVWWHSEEYKDRLYHKEKTTRLLTEYGIKLIHVWEDDWMFKNDIVKQKIKAKLGVSDKKRVYARKCEVKNVEAKDAFIFMDMNHIQGKTFGSKWIGLYFEGVLVACVGYKNKGRGVYDITRYATSENVIGGFGKLLKHLQRTLEWSEFFTYASMDYSVGDVYEKTGFVLERVTEPQMFYVKNQKRHRREQFMKHKLSDIFGNVDMNKTEKEIMRDNGYVRLFDAGSIKYVMKKENPLN